MKVKLLLYMQGPSLFTGLFIEDLTLRFYRRNERVSYYRLLKAIGLKYTPTR